MKIGLCIVCTGKYHIFLQPLIDGLEKYFFCNEEVVIYLFCDRHYRVKLSSRITIKYIHVKHKPFPYPTLYRYKYFTLAKNKIKCDYLFYIDVDMKIVGGVDKEILPDNINDCGLVATGHPGFWGGGGSWGFDERSTAFTPKEKRTQYYAGGFQGGEKKAYMLACHLMAENIRIDEEKGVMAEWHDETHWNKYLSVANKKPKVLTPEYCMVEEMETRILYGIHGLAPKIIALNKDHHALRFT